MIKRKLLFVDKLSMMIQWSTPKVKRKKKDHAQHFMHCIKLETGEIDFHDLNLRVNYRAGPWKGRFTIFGWSFGGNAKNHFSPEASMVEPIFLFHRSFYGRHKSHFSPEKEDGKSECETPTRKRDGYFANIFILRSTHSAIRAKYPSELGLTELFPMLVIQTYQRNWKLWKHDFLFRNH